MIVFLFTASSISRKQTSYKDRNVVEENNDWIIFHSVFNIMQTNKDRQRDAGHEITGDSNDYTTVDDKLVTAEPLTDQAIIDP